MTESLNEYREQLARMHTRVLLKELDASRAGYLDATQTQVLKDELSKREHVPNKIEAKQIRKEKAKAKQNR